MSEEIQKPSSGRIVLIRRLDGAPMGNGQKWAPAVVQTAWDGGLMVNACALPDCQPPEQVCSVDHESRATASGQAYGHCWTWPPRVEV